MKTIPELGSLWRHYNGIEYRVFGILNEGRDPTKPDDYHPIIICYVGANGKTWGKPLSEFLAKMEHVPEY